MQLTQRCTESDERRVDVAISSKRESVIRQWGQLVRDGGGKAHWVLNETERLIKEVAAPNIEQRRETVSSGVFSEKRDFLLVTHKSLREYAMFISARDFGRDLEVSWFLTVNPGFLKRAISKRLSSGNPNALSMSLDMFAHQDLNAYVGTAENCLHEALEHLLGDLKQDYSTIDRRSKGVLNIW
jgi:hypothetical protein